MDALLNDLRYAVRSLSRSPAFVLTAVLTLALGIAVNTAIFSVVNRLLLQPLPFRDSGRMAYVWLSDPAIGLSVGPTAPVAEAWRTRARSLEGAETYDSREVFLGGSGEAAVVPGTSVGPGFLRFLGVAPAAGRMFTADEAARGEPVALLSYGTWQRRFGGRADVAGATLQLDGKPYTVVGVMPRELEESDLGGRTEVWMPLSLQGPGPRTVSMVARLREGVTPEAAQRELAGIAAQVPDGLMPGHKWDAQLMRPTDFLDDGVHTGLLVLMGAVGLVLLIACANVAHLFLARTAARGREMAIRTSLGAGRGALVRQLLVEGLLIAAAGGTAGLLLARWGVDALVGLRPEALSTLEGVPLNGRVLLFTAGVSALTGLLFGLLPALRGARVDPAVALGGSPAGLGGSRRDARLRGGMVGLEVALSVVLVVGAGLLLRSLARLGAQEPGVRVDGVAAASVTLPPNRYSSPAARYAFAQEVRERAERLPGVTSATLSVLMPAEFGIVLGQAEVEGRAGNPLEGQLLSTDWVGPEYFATVGVPLRQGRGFTDAERASGAKVAVIGESLARRLAPGGSAVGTRFRLAPKDEWSTVVGVVGDVKGPGTHFLAKRMQMYSPLGAPQLSQGQVVVVAHTRGDAGALAAGLRSLVRSADPQVAVREASTLREAMAHGLADQRFQTLLLTTFAALALLLAAVGLFGVLTYTVQQRTREIGIRIALGAGAGRVHALVLRDVGGAAAVGVVVGLVAAAATTRLATSMFFGIEPGDAVSFAAAAVLVSGVAALVASLPARRAARVD
ncbi:MAG TPA: ABC transporter permease, partial [Longimicrobiaceae bacterium]|nr:ABC transporter permease [Longimicrobiaceae bacterium]